MTTAGNVLQVNTNTAANSQSFRAPLQWMAGFYFSFRFCVTFLAFQSDPRAGSIAYLACNALILVAAVIYTLGDKRFSMRFLFADRTVWWLLAYLAMSGLSLVWTGADSVMDAAGQWSGMVMEVATVLLLVRQTKRAEHVDAMMKGFVIGMMFVGAVAWLSPTLPDLRIGDYEFLHPNIIGMYSAIASFLAQHLALDKRGWRWCCLALGMTMLRSISKTSILAFLVAETFYLLREKQIPRGMKIKIAAAATIVIAVFGTLLSTYLENYTTSSSGNQAETLTGRTAIWSTAFFMAIEKPWIGHGFYSFRSLIPAFGSFEPWHAHNELLQEFFEYGLMGIAVTVGLYLSLFFAAKRSTSIRYGRLVFVIALFAVVHGLTESINFGLSFPLWLFAALALAVERPPLEATAS